MVGGGVREGGEGGTGRKGRRQCGFPFNIGCYKSLLISCFQSFNRGFVCHVGDYKHLVRTHDG